MPSTPPPTREQRHSTQVRRVDLYTHGSLHAMVLAVPMVAALRLVGAMADADTPASVAVALAMFAAHTAAGMWLLDTVMRRYPEVRPLPTARLVALAVTSSGAVTASQLSGIGDEARNAVLLVTSYVAAIALAPLLRGGAALFLAVAAAAVPASVADDPVRSGIVFALVAGFLIATVQVSLWLRDVVRELNSVRSAQAALAVAEERLRFSRDLHDTLGRNLSAIAVTSELAATLHEKGDPRAADRMLQVRDLAHESLGETRELVRGYRDVSFTDELAGARALLEAAGVTCTVDVADDAALTADEREMAAWVVRETATNVLRHSRANECTVRMHDRRLQISNDGAGDDTGTTAGSGLAGLRERLEPSGATLEIDWRDGQFTVTAQFGRTRP